MYIRNPYLSWLLTLALVLVFSFSMVGSASAFEFIEDGDLPAGEVIDDDLFIVGENIVIDGTVNGDLFAFGGTVVINGVVNGSLVTGAQTVTIYGEVAGSVYSGANGATLGSSAAIGRNMYFGGFALETKAGSTIARDLVVGGYQAVLAGEIGRDLVVGADALEISGVIGGDVKADIGSAEEDMGPMPFQFFMPPGAPPMIEPGIRIAEDAEIGGTVAYTSPSDQASSIEAVPAGGVVFSTPVPVEIKGTPSEEIGPVRPVLEVGRWFLQRLRELLTLLALGTLVLWLLPDLFDKVIAKATSEPLPSSGWGLLTMIVGYVGAVIVAGIILALGIFFGVLTLGGLGSTIFGVGFSSLGLAMTLFVLLVNYGSKLVIAFWGGKWILGKLAPQAAASKVWPLLLGVLIYVLLRAIPILGWVIGLVVTLIGMGAMWLVFQDWRKPVAIETEAAL